ncbi:ABC transporter ATP-binding protein [Tsukamurella soli]|uniref:ABC transporter ATP-binding protein n=1 Tax=Tsukamurella soli TaxID=644556 RepID=A0ABP8KD63_9ACTN
MTTRQEADTPVLRVSDLHVTFPSESGPVPAVRGVSFEVRPGEVLAVVGESGSGKSVSSLAVMGLLPDTARVRGSIELRGRELLGLSDRELSRVRGTSVSMVFQDPLTALTPIYRVGDQIAEALRVHDRRLDRRAAAARAVELLGLVGIPEPERRARTFPHELSGGMRQRVVIAMAIANDPDLIIADEPTTALDVTVQAQVLDLLTKARDMTGAGVILVTHDLGVVAGVADRAVVMYAGRAVETAPVGPLFAEPAMPYTLGLLGAVPRVDGDRRRLVPIEGAPPSPADLPPGCPFAPRCPMAIDQCADAEPELLPVPDTVERDHAAACIRAGEVRRLAPEEAYGVQDADGVAEPPAGDVVLRVSDLHVTYPLYKGAVLRRRAGEFEAVRGVGFELRAGRTMAIVGESGCGKSTTLMEILGFTRPRHGRIELFGTEPYALTTREQRRLRARMQVVFQDPMGSLDPRLPVSELIAEPLRVHGVGDSERRARVRELMEQVGLRPEHADRFPAQFSGGQRQRIGIARALALRPDILLLDEPVSALDVSIQAGVLNLLQDLQAELGLAYLFVSHDLSVVRYLAHDVSVMRAGEFVETGTTEQVFGAPQDPYTRALLAAVPVPDPAVARQRVARAAELVDAVEGVEAPAIAPGEGEGEA